MEHGWNDKYNYSLQKTFSWYQNLTEVSVDVCVQPVTYNDIP